MRAKRRPGQLIWPSDPFRAVRVTTVGGCRALVENHRVRVRDRQGCVCVRGRALALREVRKDALIVSGTIDAVEFCHDPSAD